MGNTTGERTDRLHTTGLLQPHFQPCSLFFSGVPLNGINNGIESHAQETAFASCRNATRPANRIKTQGDAGAVFADLRHARPAAQTNGNASVSFFTCRHAVNARNMDNSIECGADPSRKRRRLFRPTRRKVHSRPAPEL